ncbi:MAG TPA: PadR family transcriptional regulator [Streptosporangiaceae bacterium]|jgi:DNA-binding PadR family transcriptional regulator
MAAAAWGADDPFDIFECVRDALGQVREELREDLGKVRDDLRKDFGKAGKEFGKGFGKDWAKDFGKDWGTMTGGPWGGQGGEGTRSRKDRGHWGGGFGSWSGWWPGMPGGSGAPGGPGPGFARQSGGPGGSRGTKASRGDVRAAILALLREGPRNGYQIMSEIDERSGGAWRPSPGAVYPALSQLADEGLIAGEESEGKRTFRLTDAGREYIEQHPEMARGAWESAEQQEAWEVPGLFAEAARLGASIVQVAHAGTNEQVVAAERLLQRTRRELYRVLADDGDTDDGDTDEPGDQEA